MELNIKVNTDYIASSCWRMTINSVFILRKSVNYSVNIFSETTNDN